MPFTLDPAVGAAMQALAGDAPPPQFAVHDVAGRRAHLDLVFSGIMQNQPGVSDVSTQDFTTRAEDGHEILLRWFTKTGVQQQQQQQPGSAIVYAHGGGMIALSIAHYTGIIQRYVSRSGVPFLAVEYRLAPEVRSPVPVTDTYAGLRYLVSNASRLGVDPHRIGIMGDSAGGGITASLAHYIRRKGGPPVARQILVYPMLDDRTTQPQPLIAPFATWTTDDNITGWSALLGAERVGTADVDVLEAAGRMVPEEARGLPPAYIDVGELDVFRDEDIEYARNLGRGGVSCELHVGPGVPHAFEVMAPEAEVSRFIMDRRIKAIKSI